MVLVHEEARPTIPDIGSCAIKVRKPTETVKVAPASCHNQPEFFYFETAENVLKLAERLDHECGDDLVAAAYRANTCLNTGEWQLAYDAAISVTGIWPTESLTAAFAAFELGEKDAARTRFVHAMLNGPREVGITLGKRSPEPKSWTEARDYNAGVATAENLTGYLSKRSRKAKQFFDGLWKDAELAKLREEVVESERRMDKLGREDEELHRKLFDRLHALRSWEFAECIARR